MAEEAKVALVQQAADQMKTQEQLVRTVAQTSVTNHCVRPGSYMSQNYELVRHQVQR